MKRFALLGAKIGVSLALLVYLFSTTDLGALEARVRAADLLDLTAAVACYAGILALATWRWQLLLRALGWIAPSITIIGWLEFPILYRLFHRLPDRGITFAKPFGLLITMYIAWLLGSLGFLRNDASGLLFAIILSGVLGFIWVRRSGLSEMWTWMQGQWKFILAVELLFLTIFVGWAWVRSYNPEILGTEKPMEFMFINSILRSPTLPPHDAWLSSYASSYYYFGYLIIASLARLTNTSSSVAFNLGLAVIFALSSVSALGVTTDLIALVKNREQHASNGKKLSLLSSFWPGLLGPLIVIVVGNFYGVLEVTHSNGIFAKLDIPAIWYDFGQTVNPEQITPQSEFLRSFLLSSAVAL